jgi:hypothetical protein
LTLNFFHFVSPPCGAQSESLFSRHLFFVACISSVAREHPHRGSEYDQHCLSPSKTE